MRTHDWRPRSGCIGLAFVGIALLAAPSANAAVNSDLVDFNLTTTSTTWPSSFLTTVNTGVLYRWLDSPSKATVISSANCVNNTTYGLSVFAVGSTTSASIGVLPTGACFNVRGYTTSGTMSYADGRVSR